jgi:hypothetical protein
MATKSVHDQMIDAAQKLVIKTLAVLTKKGLLTEPVTLEDISAELGFEPKVKKTTAKKTASKKGEDASESESESESKGKKKKTEPKPKPTKPKKETKQPEVPEVVEKQKLTRSVFMPTSVQKAKMLAINPEFTQPKWIKDEGEYRGMVVCLTKDKKCHAFGVADKSNGGEIKPLSASQKKLVEDEGWEVVDFFKTEEKDDEEKDADEFASADESGESKEEESSSEELPKKTNRDKDGKAPIIPKLK